MTSTRSSSRFSILLHWHCSQAQPLTLETTESLRAVVFASTGVPPLRQRLYINGLLLDERGDDFCASSVTMLLARREGGFDSDIDPQPLNKCTGVTVSPQNVECGMTIHFCRAAGDGVGPVDGAGAVERSVEIGSGGVKAVVTRKVLAAGAVRFETVGATRFCVFAGGFPNGGESGADVHAPWGTNHGGPPPGGVVVIACRVPTLPVDGAEALARFERSQVVLLDASPPLPAVDTAARDLDEALEVARAFAASFGASDDDDDDGPSAAELQLRAVLPHVPHGAVALALAQNGGRVDAASGVLLDASAAQLTLLSVSAAAQPEAKRAVAEMRRAARSSGKDPAAAGKLLQIGGRVRANAMHVRAYENEATVLAALKCVPLPLLHTRSLKRMASADADADADAVAEEAAETLKQKRARYRDALLREVSHWFKNDFFKWVNSPSCERCGAGGCHAINGGQLGLGPTAEERRWGANRVEVYTCSDASCGFGNTRFPRYNSPLKLFQTRRGRCGEWANAFTSLCRALAFDARHVSDWSDHVWTEVWSDLHHRWLHCDSCEDAIDAPLMYESGWGKSLSLIVASGRDGCVDVTRRYTRKWRREVAARRADASGLGVNEVWLATNIDNVDARQARWACSGGGPEARCAAAGCGEFSEVALRALHVRIRKREEETEFAASLEEEEAAVVAAAHAAAAATVPEETSSATRELHDAELRGRISGSVAWRTSRGELGERDAAAAPSDGGEQRVLRGERAAALFTAIAPLHSWVETARDIVFTPRVRESGAEHALGIGRIQCELRSCSGAWRAASISIVRGCYYNNDDGHFSAVAAHTLDSTTDLIPRSVGDVESLPSHDRCALAIVLKLLRNLLQRVGDDGGGTSEASAAATAQSKFRVIKKSNVKLQERLFSSARAVSTLRHYGWLDEEVDDVVTPHLRGGGGGNRVEGGGEERQVRALLAYRGRVEMERLRVAVARLEALQL